MRESQIIQENFERFFSDHPFADVLMPVKHEPSACGANDQIHGVVEYEAVAE